MQDYLKLAKEVIEGKAISPAESLSLLQTPNSELPTLLAASDKIRRYFFGNKVKLCGIVNAKSGRCSENCSFCAQSAHYQTNCQVYPLMSEKELVAAAKSAEKNMSATCFSFVTSGKTVHANSELRTLGSALSTVSRETKLNRCVSLGTLDFGQIQRLKASGLTRLHHNLETAESFFPNLCTTHAYADRLRTIKTAKEAGLEVCSGGIFGLGENLEQRIELAFALKDLEVASVPINILQPVPGTPAVKNHKPMTPFEILKLVATYRFILSDKDVGVFGGREKALGSLQPLMFMAGANVTLIGDYLTTKGQPPEKDLQMIRELELEINNRLQP